MMIRNLASAGVGATVLALAALSSATAAQAAAQPQSFDIAITVDDLTAHGSLPVGTTRAAIGQATLAALKAHHVPEAYGFVNAIHLKQEPESEQMLKDWRAAGYPLGNHTYSHKNINAGTVEAFEADIEAGEPSLKQYMGDADWHYLRFPYLSAGDAAHHDPVNTWLKAHGYKIADVSVSFSDWAYTETYNRCLAKGDMAAIEGLKARYLGDIDPAIARMKALSQKVYGRMIPQVLLTHIGGFSAIMLPQVLDKLEAAGAHYVTLEQAQSDPAYAETDPKAGDGVVMDRTAYEKGIDISAVPAAPSIAGIDDVCK